MTLRTKTDLDTLFADNTSGDIEPVDLRDFVDTATHSHGSLYVSSSVATVIAVAGTFTKMLGSTSSVDLHRFTMPTDNRLTYTGTTAQHAHIVVNLSTSAASNNQVLQFAVAKNGALLAHSIMEHKVTTASESKIMTLHADTTLAQNDYLEIWCTNTTSTATLTGERAYLYVMGMLRDNA